MQNGEQPATPDAYDRLIPDTNGRSASATRRLRLERNKKAQAEHARRKAAKDARDNESFMQTEVAPQLPPPRRRDNAHGIQDGVELGVVGDDLNERSALLGSGRSNTAKEINDLKDLDFWSSWYGSLLAKWDVIKYSLFYAGFNLVAVAWFATYLYEYMQLDISEEIITVGSASDPFLYYVFLAAILKNPETWLNNPLFLFASAFSGLNGKALQPEIVDTNITCIQPANYSRPFYDVLKLMDPEGSIELSTSPFEDCDEGFATLAERNNSIISQYDLPYKPRFYGNDTDMHRLAAAVWILAPLAFLLFINNPREADKHMELFHNLAWLVEFIAKLPFRLAGLALQSVFYIFTLCAPDFRRTTYHLLNDMQNSLTFFHANYFGDNVKNAALATGVNSNNNGIPKTVLGKKVTSTAARQILGNTPCYTSDGAKHNVGEPIANKLKNLTRALNDAANQSRTFYETAAFGITTDTRVINDIKRLTRMMLGAADATYQIPDLYRKKNPSDLRTLHNEIAEIIKQLNEQYTDNEKDRKVIDNLRISAHQLLQQTASLLHDERIPHLVKDYLSKEIWHISDTHEYMLKMIGRVPVLFSILVNEDTDAALKRIGARTSDNYARPNHLRRRLRAVREHYQEKMLRKQMESTDLLAQFVADSYQYQYLYGPLGESSIEHFQQHHYIRNVDNPLYDEHFAERPATLVNPNYQAASEAPYYDADSMDSDDDLYARINSDYSDTSESDQASRVQHAAAQNADDSPSYDSAYDPASNPQGAVYASVGSESGTAEYDNQDYHPGTNYIDVSPFRPPMPLPLQATVIPPQPSRVRQPIRVQADANRTPKFIQVEMSLKANGKPQPKVKALFGGYDEENEIVNLRVIKSSSQPMPAHFAPESVHELFHNMDLLMIPGDERCFITAVAYAVEAEDHEQFVRDLVDHFNNPLNKEQYADAGIDTEEMAYIIEAIASGDQSGHDIVKKIVSVYLNCPLIIFNSITSKPSIIRDENYQGQGAIFMHYTPRTENSVEKYDVMKVKKEEVDAAKLTRDVLAAAEQQQDLRFAPKMKKPPQTVWDLTLAGPDTPLIRLRITTPVSRTVPTEAQKAPPTARHFISVTQGYAPKAKDRATSTRLLDFLFDDTNNVRNWHDYAKGQSNNLGVVSANLVGIHQEVKRLATAENDSFASLQQKLMSKYQKRAGGNHRASIRNDHDAAQATFLGARLARILKDDIAAEAKNKMPQRHDMAKAAIARYVEEARGRGCDYKQIFTEAVVKAVYVLLLDSNVEDSIDNAVRSHAIEGLNRYYASVARSQPQRILSTQFREARNSGKDKRRHTEATADGNSPTSRMSATTNL